MKKLVTSAVVLLTAIGVCMSMSGCKVTPEQGKVIAQNAGLYSAVVWIAVDNPTSNQIVEVKGIIGEIKDKAKSVEAGKTYMEVLYPELVKVIDEKVIPQDRPLCKAAAMTLLNGLDTMFALHPEWKANQDLAIDMVSAYVDGAETGLSISESSDVMKQARATSVARAKIWNGQ